MFSCGVAPLSLALVMWRWVKYRSDGAAGRNLGGLFVAMTLRLEFLVLTVADVQLIAAGGK